MYVTYMCVMYTACMLRVYYHNACMQLLLACDMLHFKHVCCSHVNVVFM